MGGKLALSVEPGDKASSLASQPLLRARWIPHLTELVWLGGMFKTSAVEIYDLDSCYGRED